jgi:hypothetical protein
MGMQTDVKGASCPASTATTVYAGRTRFKGLTFSSSGSTTITILDGATTLFTYTIAGEATTSVFVPAEGVLCSTSLVVTCGANVTAVAFYG